VVTAGGVAVLDAACPLGQITWLTPPPAMAAAATTNMAAAARSPWDRRPGEATG
jgi:hypothetical protein